MAIQYPIRLHLAFIQHAIRVVIDAHWFRMESCVISFNSSCDRDSSSVKFVSFLTSRPNSSQICWIGDKSRDRASQGKVVMYPCCVCGRGLSCWKMIPRWHGMIGITYGSRIAGLSINDIDGRVSYVMAPPHHHTRCGSSAPLRTKGRIKTFITGLHIRRRLSSLLKLNLDSSLKKKLVPFGCSTIPSSTTPNGGDSRRVSLW